MTDVACFAAAVIRSARRRTVSRLRGLEGPVTPDLLDQHPPAFSASLKVYDEMIEDAFSLARGSTGRRSGPGLVHLATLCR